jgi:hypothetical protein
MTATRVGDADEEVTGISVHKDVVESSSASDRDGGEDHEGSEVEHEDAEDADDGEASGDEDTDPEIIGKKKAVEAAAAGRTFFFGPSTITESRIRMIEKLK